VLAEPLLRHYLKGQNVELDFLELEERIIQIAVDSAYDDDCYSRIVALTNRGRILVKDLYDEDEKWSVKFDGKLKVYGEDE